MHTTRFPSPAAAVALAALTILALPQRARADWPASGLDATPFPAAQQHSVIATDGADGAIVAWQDLRNPRVNIFAQHLLATGSLDRAWPAGGRALLRDSLAIAGTAGGQFAPVIVSDGAGGAVVAWEDNRSAVTETDVFAQHVLATGVVDPAWPANGAALCAATGLQNTLAIAPDGKGGAIVAWVDGRVSANTPDIFAQHVLSTGGIDPGFPADGLAICTAAGPQGFPVILDDGLGGALIAWQDGRAPLTTGFDVYAQHLLSLGIVDPVWPVNGAPVCTAVGDQGRPTIASDGADGAIIAWSDSRIVATSHIFAEHVLGTGNLDRAWPVNGRAVSAAELSETRPLAVADGAGGAIVNWQGFTVHLNMYAQHVLASGVVDPVWPAGGRALSNRDRQQTFAEIASDGAGGAIVAWDDSFDVVAQHVLANGAFDPTYPDTGRMLVNLPSKQGDPAIVATSGGGAIVSWTDGRNGSDIDIFALQVLAAGTVDVSPPGPAPGLAGLAFAPAAPNPAREAFSLRYVLPREGFVRLAIFDATGRRVRELVAGTRSAGDQSVPWDLRDGDGASVRPGVYFARLDVDGRVLTEKLVRVE